MITAQQLHQEQKDAFDRWFDRLPQIKEGYSGFRFALQQLQLRCPLRFPIVLMRVRKSHMEGNMGELRCYFEESPQWIGILLSAALTQRDSTETLIHEWAHAMTADPSKVWGVPFPQHGRAWGIAYAKAYQAAFGEASRCARFSRDQKDFEGGRIIRSATESSLPK